VFEKKFLKKSPVQPLPVASGEAMVMLHWVMCYVSHQQTTMAIEVARDGGPFFCRRSLFRLR